MAALQRVGQETPTKITRYRNDIDGLRALAVLLVLFSHLGLNSFRGGFIGVDVFFVISGYLITQDIVKRIQNGSFSFGGFYERRFRRIAPALTVMLSIVALISYFILLPVDFLLFSKSLVAAALCYSNIEFALTNTGYFGAQYSNLLLHTWSLGVEEQFYLVIPLCLVLAAKWGLKVIKWSLVAGIILSFIISVVAVRHNQDLAFYMPYVRAWELPLV